MLVEFDGFDLDDAGLGAAALTQKSLLDAQQLLGVLLDALPVALLIHTEQGVLFSNREACRLLNSDKPRLTGQHFLDFVASTDAPSIAAIIRGAFGENGTTSQQECVIRPASGEQRLVAVTVGMLPWEGTPVVQILFRDITDQKRAEASLRQLTITDELTGAYNRRHAFYEASLYIGQLGSGDMPLSVAMIDIDRFKRINDTYGHGMGDEALKHLTKLANSFLPVVRDADSALFARIGGEEFVMLLPGIGERRAVAIAEQFRAVIEGSSVVSGGTSVRFTASIGVAAYRREDGSFDRLLARADEALYRAKETGRNKVLAGR